MAQYMLAIGLVRSWWRPSSYLTTKPPTVTVGQKREKLKPKWATAGPWKRKSINQGYHRNNKTKQKTLLIKSIERIVNGTKIKPNINLTFGGLSENRMWVVLVWKWAVGLIYQIAIVGIESGPDRAIWHQNMPHNMFRCHFGKRGDDKGRCTNLFFLFRSARTS